MSVRVWSSITVSALLLTLVAGCGGSSPAPHSATAADAVAAATAAPVPTGALRLAGAVRRPQVLDAAALAALRALVSYGEVSPDSGNRRSLVSPAEDGAPLPRPRLVVPGVVKGGRYVSDLVELRVVRVGG